MVVLGNCKEIVPEGHRSSSVETSHDSEKLDPRLGTSGTDTTLNSALSAESETQQHKPPENTVHVVYVLHFDEESRVV